VRRQAKRDAALESAGGTELTKTPSPLRFAAALQMVAHLERASSLNNIEIEVEIVTDRF
jgi:hypothetical protein